MTITSQTLPLALADNVAAMEMLQPPNHLPVLWLDAKYSVAGEQYAINRGTGGSALDARYGSTTGADTNDPLLLTHTGENYAYLPGVAGNYLSVPDEAALDITGDIELVFRVSMADWTPALRQGWFGKRETVGQLSYWLALNDTTNGMVFSFSQDGTAVREVGFGSALTTVIADGATVWVKATLDIDNGSGGVTATLYVQPDQATEPTSWGSGSSGTIATAASSIFSGTSAIAIGQYATSTQPMAGAIKRTIVRNGIGGTTVLDINCATDITSSAATTFTATTGQTVTVNRSSPGRKTALVTRPVWLFGTDDYMEIADNALLDFGASDSFTVLAVVRQWGTPTAYGRYVRKGAGVAASAGYQLSSDGTSLKAGGFVGDGVDTVTAIGNALYTAGAPQVLSLVVDRATALQAIYQNTTAGTSASTALLGDIRNALAFSIGRDVTPSGYQDFELLAVAVFRRALTADEIANICSYYGTV